MSSWKDKDLLKCTNEQKRKKGCPLHFATISLTEKTEETSQEHPELHIKNNILMEKSNSSYFEYKIFACRRRGSS